MDAPETNAFFNVGQEWRGVPSPKEAAVFCRKIEAERNQLRASEARAMQTLSIARQTISSQLATIDRLEKQKFATQRGTEGRGASSPPSFSGGILEIACYWEEISECTCTSGHPVGGCLKCDMKQIRTLLVH